MRDKHPEAGVRPRGEKRKDDTMLKKSLSLLLAGALTVSLAVPAVAGNSQAQPKQDPPTAPPTIWTPPLARPTGTA